MSTTSPRRNQPDRAYGASNPRSDLAPHSQADLDAVAAELNGRPRQTLGWMTPSEALNQALR
jgi:IS30 family transposase